MSKPLSASLLSLKSSTKWNTCKVSMLFHVQQMFLVLLILHICSSGKYRLYLSKCDTTICISCTQLGSAIFTINPTNVTTCLGTPAVFTCVITEPLPIGWLINGTPIQSPPPTTPLTPGPGSQSTLSVTATSELNGAPVQCYYTPSVLLPSIVSPPAYLSVQGL